MMKTLTISMIALMISFTCQSQTKKNDILSHIDKEEKEKNTLYSIMTYDSLGNQFQVKKSYDHLPTHEDSVEFAATAFENISKLIDEYYEEQKLNYKQNAEIQIKKARTKNKIKKISQ